MRKPEILHPHATIGVRSFKTAITCVLCALLYYFVLIGRNPTFALIGVIFGSGGVMPNSKLHGGNRLIGTIIGGLLGMGLFRLYLFAVPDGRTTLWLLPFIFVGVLLLIFMSQFFYWPGAVQPGGVVLCIILYNTPVDTYISYSLNRMLDTGIGVVMALLVEALLPKSRLICWYNKLFPKHQIKQPDDSENS